MYKRQPLTRFLRLAHELAAVTEPDALVSVAGAYGLEPQMITTVMQNAAAQVAQTARDMGIDISAVEPRPTPVMAAPTPSDEEHDAARSQLVQEVHDLSVLREICLLYTSRCV